MASHMPNTSNATNAPAAPPATHSSRLLAHNSTNPSTASPSASATLAPTAGASIASVNLTDGMTLDRTALPLQSSYNNSTNITNNNTHSSSTNTPTRVVALMKKQRAGGGGVGGDSTTEDLVTADYASSSSNKIHIEGTASSASPPPLPIATQHQQLFSTIPTITTSSASPKPQTLAANSNIVMTAKSAPSGNQFQQPASLHAQANSNAPNGGSSSQLQQQFGNARPSTSNAPVNVSRAMGDANSADGGANAAGGNANNNNTHNSAPVGVGENVHRLSNSGISGVRSVNGLFSHRGSNASEFVLNSASQGNNNSQQHGVSSQGTNGSVGKMSESHNKRGGNTTHHTSFDAVTTFDLENDRDCPPTINTNVLRATTASSSTNATTTTGALPLHRASGSSNPNSNNNTTYSKNATGDNNHPPPYQGFNKNGAGGGGGGLGAVSAALNNNPLQNSLSDGDKSHSPPPNGGAKVNEGSRPPPIVTRIDVSKLVLPPSAKEDRAFTDSSADEEEGGKVGQRAYNQQSQLPLSARSYTATSRGKRHVTVHAPSDNAGGSGGGGGGNNNNTSNQQLGVGFGQGSMRGGTLSTFMSHAYGGAVSESVFGVLVGGITDDFYFGVPDSVNSLMYGGCSVMGNSANSSGLFNNASLSFGQKCIAFFLHPIITATLCFALIALYCVARLVVECVHMSDVWGTSKLVDGSGNLTSVDVGRGSWEGRGELVGSGAFWSSVLCLLIVVSTIIHVLILIAHHMYNTYTTAKALRQHREAYLAKKKQREEEEAKLGVVGEGGNNGSITSSFNDSGLVAGNGKLKHNRAARISTTVAFAIISISLIAMSVIEGVSGGAHLLALTLPIIATTALRPIMSSPIVLLQGVLSFGAVLAVTILLQISKNQLDDTVSKAVKDAATLAHSPSSSSSPLLAANSAIMDSLFGASDYYYRDYFLPQNDRLWFRLSAFADLIFISLYAVLAQFYRGDGRTHGLSREQQAVASILHQLVDLNVESAKKCLDDALMVNPSLAMGGYDAFSAAVRLINGLTLFRSYVPTAVGGLSECFSSDDESIPDDDDEHLTATTRFGGLKSNSSFVFSGRRAAQNGNGSNADQPANATAHSAASPTNNNLGAGIAAINMSLTPRLGPMNSPKLTPMAPHPTAGHPIPAPLEAHFGVKTTFRKRWVTVMHMFISPPSSGLDTTLAEAIGNAVCGPVVDTVAGHRGVVEHMGPMSIVISFNCRVPCVMHESEACKAASLIAEDLTTILPPEIKFAIVVASGYCIVGDFGVDTHRAKVILGDAMDIITRVPPLAMKLGAKVVLTEDTASRVSFDTAPIDNILVGGLNAESRFAGGGGITYNLTSGGSNGRSIILYELRSVVKGARGMIKSPDSTLYASGFSAFRCGEFAAAADRFRRYVATNKDDAQAQRILDLCNWFALNGVNMGPRTYLRREVAWELFDGEIDPSKRPMMRFDAVSPIPPPMPPSPRFNGSTITPSMRSRESSSRDVSEMVRMQIMSNPNVGGGSKMEFQDEGLFSMFIVPEEDGEDSSNSNGSGNILDVNSNNGGSLSNGPTNVAGGAVAGPEASSAMMPLVPSPTAPSVGPPANTSGKFLVAQSGSSIHEGGGPSSSRKGGASVTPTTTTGGAGASINYNLSVVNGVPVTGSSGRAASVHQHIGIFNHSIGSVNVPQPSHHYYQQSVAAANNNAQQHQPFLDPHEEMLLLSSDIPLEFLDSSGDRWKRSNTKLGSGAGGAEVYLALGEQGNLVALKCFSLASTKTNQEELIQEVGTLSRLRDDFIVGYVSYAITANHFIILMEYVSGGSLYQLLEQFGPMALSTARRFMTDILKGLRYLHEERTTHCDIKPHNALLSTEGSCKLTDFGSCMPAGVLEALHQQGPGGIMDDLPLVRGTSWYLAPEAARGEVLLANDIWSVGITLIELLTGSHPWQGSPYATMGEMAFIIKLGKDPTMQPKIPPTIDGPARDFIQQCLQRNPADRPTAVELLSHPFIIS